MIESILYGLILFFWLTNIVVAFIARWLWNIVFIQFTAVFLGALLAGVINYWLQNRLLNKQKKAMDNERLKDAYSELLLLLDQIELGGWSVMGMINSLTLVSRIGGEKVKPVAKRALPKSLPGSYDRADKIWGELKTAIEDELNEM